MMPFDASSASLLGPSAEEPIGVTIVRASSSIDYYTPWFFRTTDQGTFGCEVITLPTDVTITFTIQKKFRDETDDEAKNGSSASFTAAGVKTVRQTALDDLVRYKITIAGAASVGHAHLRLLAACWEPH
jgi:hypothetical protein